MPALALADQSRIALTSKLDPLNRSKLGQYMTPAPIASFMASMFGELPTHVRLLDAGAGMGALTAAFVQELTSREKRPAVVDVTAFELDPMLAEQLEITLAECSTECARAGISFTSRVVRDDFILHATEPLIGTHAAATFYDCVILNPPYAKISNSSAWRRALRRSSIETSNLYTAFIAVALKQLKMGGQLVAITPRSFCNGSYFEPFRRYMLELATLEHVHVYESRKKAFRDDDVLQENIIFRVSRSDEQTTELVVSSSEGPASSEVVKRRVPFAEIVIPTDKHRFIRLPTTNEEGCLAVRIRSLPSLLKDLGLTVSTGRVVDFRAKEHLRQDPAPDTAPLIYATHFKDGFVAWPKADSRKPNAIALNENTKDLFVPRGTYVLTKRFTAKEERRRIVACIYDSERFDADQIGFENHLNYFHINGAGLPRDLAAGLSTFLNSSVVDQFFRQFSGHTQVNATDLRNLHYPSVGQLIAMGAHVGHMTPNQSEIDSLVNDLF